MRGTSTSPHPQAPSFLAVDKNTGKVLWQDNVPSQRSSGPRASWRPVAIKELVNTGLLLMHGQWSNPVYAEVNGKPQIIFPGGDGWIRGFDPANGKLIWKFDCNPKDAVLRPGRQGHAQRLRRHAGRLREQAVHRRRPGPRARRRASAISGAST